MLASLVQLAALSQNPDVPLAQEKTEGTRLMVIPDWVPVMLGVTASVAVRVCAPAVLNVTPLLNTCTPLSPPGPLKV